MERENMEREMARKMKRKRGRRERGKETERRKENDGGGERERERGLERFLSGDDMSCVSTLKGRLYSVHWRYHNFFPGSHLFVPLQRQLIELDITSRHAHAGMLFTFSFAH